MILEPCLPDSKVLEHCLHKRMHEHQSHCSCGDGSFFVELVPCLFLQAQQNPVQSLGCTSQLHSYTAMQAMTVTQAMPCRSWEPGTRDMRSTWAQWHQDNRQLTMPHMFSLVAIGLLPLNSAVVERGFSLHFIIKNKLRNRLKVAQVFRTLCALR